MGNQPSLFEEWEGVSMHVEDLEPETVIANALVKEKRGSFLKTIGVVVKDVFGMRKENVPPAAAS